MRKRTKQNPQRTKGGAFESRSRPFRIALVTAHPDDEVLFFTPIIRRLLRDENCELYLLCLSTGNFDGKGHLRTSELMDCCRALGFRDAHVATIGPLERQEGPRCCLKNNENRLAEQIPNKSPRSVPPPVAAGPRVVVCDDTKMQDGPGEVWPLETIMTAVSQIAVSDAVVDGAGGWCVDAVLTFDEDGVSGHPNHCAIAPAMQLLCAMAPGAAASVQEHRRTDGKKLSVGLPGAQNQDAQCTACLHAPRFVFVLESDPVLVRKYSGPIGALAIVVWCSIVAFLQSTFSIFDADCKESALLECAPRVALSSIPLPPSYLDSRRNQRSNFVWGGWRHCISDVAVGWRGMTCHHSQLVWYRFLFLIFSRFSYLSTIRNLDDVPVASSLVPSQRHLIHEHRTQQKRGRKGKARDGTRNR